MDIDRLLRAEIDEAIARTRAAGGALDADGLATEITERWEEPKGRGSGNWLYQTRDALRKAIQAVIDEQA